MSAVFSQALLIGAGGFAGALLRYAIASGAQKLFTTSLPVGTLIVNLVGCFVIGVVAGLFEARGASWELRLLVIVGLLGGFTTFSAFGFESLTLLRRGEVWLALGNVLAQVVGGIGAVWLGLRTTT